MYLRGGREEAGKSFGQFRRPNKFRNEAGTVTIQRIIAVYFDIISSFPEGYRKTTRKISPYNRSSGQVSNPKLPQYAVTV
jgi:hypothetical protein